MYVRDHPAFRCALVLAVAIGMRSAAAQTLTVLHAFDGNDGKMPIGTLVRGNDGNFYGTTCAGGPADAGTVFAMTPAGAVTRLHAFDRADGSCPVAALVEGADGSLYGTTSESGTGPGTVFRISASGAFATLHTFAPGSGAGSALAWGNDGNLYGVTDRSGEYDSGTVYRVGPDGTFATICSFPAVAAFVYGNTNGGLLRGPDGSFYGTRSTGNGVSSLGYFYRVTTSGTLTTLRAFTGPDGAFPIGRLVVGADGAFYGTTSNGGAGNTALPAVSRAGTVFRVTTAGELTTLYSFTAPQSGSVEPYVVAGSDGNLWGTTAAGGSGAGSIFRLTPAGVLTNVFEFENDLDGSGPFGGLAASSDGSFYGTASFSGENIKGTAFRLTRDPELLVPVVLDGVSGVAGSRYSTELTLASKSTASLRVDLTYTASLGSGSGTRSLTLSPGETRILPNALDFLRDAGLPIPDEGAVGTLRTTFVGADKEAHAFVGGRTFTAAPGGGTFGVFTPSAVSATASLTILGLQENAQHRSNLALVNASPAPQALKVALYGPLGEDLGTLPDVVLPAWGWAQLSQPFRGRAAAGRAVVTGSTPFTAYGVLNDAITSAGAYLPPITPGAGLGDRLIPVVLDVHGIGGSHYTSELTLANLSGESRLFELVYTAAIGSDSGFAFLELAPWEQRIVPDVISFLRSPGLPIPVGENVAGSLLLRSLTSWTPGATFGAGVRTSTPAKEGGTFGTYMPSLGFEEWAQSVAYVNGLQQNAAQRSNLAFVNCGDASDAIQLEVRLFDETGTARGAPVGISLAPGQWFQLGQPLAAVGAAAGYARVEKISGKSAFVAYGILNDAVTSAGTYLPMSF